MLDRIRVTVWGENVHERKNPLVRRIYPRGMHTAIAEGIAEDRSLKVRTATLQQPQHGLTRRVLDETDVLVWWGHAAHGKVRDTVVERVLARVWEGMGFIALHSSHYSKPFMRLMGTSCSIVWREAGERERLWVCNPAHPIARGNGKIFYFRPGHEVYPIYYNKSVRLVLRNAVRWAASDGVKWIDSCPQISAKNAPESLEVRGPRLHSEGETGFR